jgi:hypothetical protein
LLLIERRLISYRNAAWRGTCGLDHSRNSPHRPFLVLPVPSLILSATTPTYTLLPQIADMHKKSGAHASSAGPGGLLYVVGGYDVSNPENEYMADGESAQHAQHAQ